METEREMKELSTGVALGGAAEAQASDADADTGTGALGTGEAEEMADDSEPLNKGQLSPLSGSYLLIVLAEPHSVEDRERIIKRLTKGLLSWDTGLSHVDLNCELLNLSNSAPDGDEGRNGEKLVQWASENLVVEVLIHSQVNTLFQCMKNLLSSFTRHRHIIHAGYTFQGTGSWILQDGTFSSTDFLELWSEPEVVRLLTAYKGDVSVVLQCAAENGWTEERLRKESFSKLCQLSVNSPDKLGHIHNAGISSFVEYLSKFVLPSPLTEILESSDIVGNIRFSHPTLYVFPGGQGDAALFGVNGFNMLIDGGFARKACFWDFTRHLDRLDAVLLTRVNNNSIGGLGAILERKTSAQVFPQIGHFFGNIIDPQGSSSEDKEPGAKSDDLIVSLTEQGHRMVENLRNISLKPQLCYRDSTLDPINLYHKVGHGKLDLYILNPARDSRELKEFLSKWTSNAASTAKLPVRGDPARELSYPVLNLVSICALLVWQPANPKDRITRILFPGSTPQHKIFEALSKLKHLEFLKHPVCTAETLAVTQKSKLKSETLVSEAKYQLSSALHSNRSSGTTLSSGVQKSASQVTTKAAKASLNKAEKQQQANGIASKSESSSTLNKITETNGTTTVQKEKAADGQEQTNGVIETEKSEVIKKRATNGVRGRKLEKTIVAVSNSTSSTEITGTEKEEKKEKVIERSRSRKIESRPISKLVPAPVDNKQLENGKDKEKETAVSKAPISKISTSKKSESSPIAKTPSVPRISSRPPTGRKMQGLAPEAQAATRGRSPSREKEIKSVPSPAIAKPSSKYGISKSISKSSTAVPGDKDKVTPSSTTAPPKSAKEAVNRSKVLTEQEKVTKSHRQVPISKSSQVITSAATTSASDSSKAIGESKPKQIPIKAAKGIPRPSGLPKAADKSDKASSGKPPVAAAPPGIKAVRRTSAAATAAAAAAAGAAIVGAAVAATGVSIATTSEENKKVSDSMASSVKETATNGETEIPIEGKQESEELSGEEKFESELIQEGLNGADESKSPVADADTDEVGQIEIIERVATPEKIEEAEAVPGQMNSLIVESGSELSSLEPEVSMSSGISQDDPEIEAAAPMESTPSSTRTVHNDNETPLASKLHDSLEDPDEIEKENEDEEDEYLVVEKSLEDDEFDVNERAIAAQAAKEVESSDKNIEESVDDDLKQEAEKLQGEIDTSVTSATAVVESGSSGHQKDVDVEISESPEIVATQVECKENVNLKCPATAPLTPEELIEPPGEVAADELQIDSVLAYREAAFTSPSDIVSQIGLQDENEAGTEVEFTTQSEIKMESSFSSKSPPPPHEISSEKMPESSSPSPNLSIEPEPEPEQEQEIIRSQSEVSNSGAGFAFVSSAEEGSEPGSLIITEKPDISMSMSMMESEKSAEAAAVDMDVDMSNVAEDEKVSPEPDEAEDQEEQDQSQIKKMRSDSSSTTAPAHISPRSLSTSENETEEVTPPDLRKVSIGSVSDKIKLSVDDADSSTAEGGRDALLSAQQAEMDRESKGESQVVTLEENKKESDKEESPTDKDKKEIEIFAKDDALSQVVRDRESPSPQLIDERKRSSIGAEEVEKVSGFLSEKLSPKELQGEVMVSTDHKKIEKEIQEPLSLKKSDKTIPTDSLPSPCDSLEETDGTETETEDQCGQAKGKQEKAETSGKDELSPSPKKLESNLVDLGTGEAENKDECVSSDSPKQQEYAESNKTSPEKVKEKLFGSVSSEKDSTAKTDRRSSGGESLKGEEEEVEVLPAFERKVSATELQLEGTQRMDKTSPHSVDTIKLEDSKNEIMSPLKLEEYEHSNSDSGEIYELLKKENEDVEALSQEEKKSEFKEVVSPLKHEIVTNTITTESSSVKREHGLGQLEQLSPHSDEKIQIVGETEGNDIKFTDSSPEKGVEVSPAKSEHISPAESTKDESKTGDLSSGISERDTVKPEEFSPTKSEKDVTKSGDISPTKRENDIKFAELSLRTNETDVTKSIELSPGKSEKSVTESEDLSPAKSRKDTKSAELSPAKNETDSTKSTGLSSTKTEKDMPKSGEISPVKSEKDMPKSGEISPVKSEKDIPKSGEISPAKSEKDIPKSGEISPAQSVRDVRSAEYSPAKSEKDTKSAELLPAKSEPDITKSTELTPASGESDPSKSPEHSPGKDDRDTKPAVLSPAKSETDATKLTDLSPSKSEKDAGGSEEVSTARSGKDPKSTELSPTETDANKSADPLPPKTETDATKSPESSPAKSETGATKSPEPSPAKSETVATKSSERSPAKSETGATKSPEPSPAKSETVATKSSERSPAKSETVATKSTEPSSAKSEEGPTKSPEPSPTKSETDATKSTEPSPAKTVADATKSTEPSPAKSETGATKSPEPSPTKSETEATKSTGPSPAKSETDSTKSTEPSPAKSETDATKSTEPASAKTETDATKSTEPSLAKSEKDILKSEGVSTDKIEENILEPTELSPVGITKSGEISPAQSEKNVRSAELHPAKSEKDTKSAELLPAKIEADVTKSTELPPVNSESDTSKSPELSSAKDDKDAKPTEHSPAKTEKDAAKSTEPSPTKSEKGVSMSEDVSRAKSEKDILEYLEFSPSDIAKSKEISPAQSGKYVRSTELSPAKYEKDIKSAEVLPVETEADVNKSTKIPSGSGESEYSKSPELPSAKDEKDNKSDEISPSKSEKDESGPEVSPARSGKGVKSAELSPAKNEVDTTKSTESSPAKSEKGVSRSEDVSSAKSEKDILESLEISPSDITKSGEISPAQSEKDVRSAELSPAKSEKDTKSAEVLPAKTEADFTKSTELPPANGESNDRKSPELSSVKDEKDTEPVVLSPSKSEKDASEPEEVSATGSGKDAKSAERLPAKSEKGVSKSQDVSPAKSGKDIPESTELSPCDIPKSGEISPGQSEKDVKSAEHSLPKIEKDTDAKELSQAESGSYDTIKITILPSVEKDSESGELAYSICEKDETITMKSESQIPFADLNKSIKHDEFLIGKLSEFESSGIKTTEHDLEVSSPLTKSKRDSLTISGEESPYGSEREISDEDLISSKVDTGFKLEKQLNEMVDILGEETSMKSKAVLSTSMEIKVGEDDYLKSEKSDIISPTKAESFSTTHKLPEFETVDAKPENTDFGFESGFSSDIQRPETEILEEEIDTVDKYLQAKPKSAQIVSKPGEILPATSEKDVQPSTSTPAVKEEISSLKFETPVLPSGKVDISIPPVVKSGAEMDGTLHKGEAKRSSIIPEEENSEEVDGSSLASSEKRSSIGQSESEIRKISVGDLLFSPEKSSTDTETGAFGGKYEPHLSPDYEPSEMLFATNKITTLKSTLTKTEAVSSNLNELESFSQKRDTGISDLSSNESEVEHQFIPSSFNTATASKATAPFNIPENWSEPSAASSLKGIIEDDRTPEPKELSSKEAKEMGSHVGSMSPVTLIKGNETVTTEKEISPLISKSALAKSENEGADAYVKVKGIELANSEIDVSLEKKKIDEKEYVDSKDSKSLDQDMQKQTFTLKDSSPSKEMDKQKSELNSSQKVITDMEFFTTKKPENQGFTFDSNPLLSKPSETETSGKDGTVISFKPEEKSEKENLTPDDSLEKPSLPEKQKFQETHPEPVKDDKHPPPTFYEETTPSGILTDTVSVKEIKVEETATASSAKTAVTSTVSAQGSSSRPIPIPSAIPPNFPRETREVIRTPDEVAELPVHEEVEPGTYETDGSHHSPHPGEDDQEEEISDDDHSEDYLAGGQEVRGFEVLSSQTGKPGDNLQKADTKENFDEKPEKTDSEPSRIVDISDIKNGSGKDIAGSHSPMSIENNENKLVPSPNESELTEESSSRQTEVEVAPPHIPTPPAVIITEKIDSSAAQTAILEPEPGSKASASTPAAVAAFPAEKEKTGDKGNDKVIIFSTDPIKVTTTSVVITPSTPPVRQDSGSDSDARHFQLPPNQEREDDEECQEIQIKVKDDKSSKLPDGIATEDFTSDAGQEVCEINFEKVTVKSSTTAPQKIEEAINAAVSKDKIPESRTTGMFYVGDDQEEDQEQEPLFQEDVKSDVEDDEIYEIAGTSPSNGSAPLATTASTPFGGFIASGLLSAATTVSASVIRTSPEELADKGDSSRENSPTPAEEPVFEKSAAAVSAPHASVVVVSPNLHPNEDADVDDLPVAPGTKMAFGMQAADKSVPELEQKINTNTTDDVNNKSWESGATTTSSGLGSSFVLEKVKVSESDFESEGRQTSGTAADAKVAGELGQSQFFISSRSTLEDNLEDNYNKTSRSEQISHMFPVSPNKNDGEVEKGDPEKEFKPEDLRRESFGGEKSIEKHEDDIHTPTRIYETQVTFESTTPLLLQPQSLESKQDSEVSGQPGFSESTEISGKSIIQSRDNKIIRESVRSSSSSATVSASPATAIALDSVTAMRASLEAFTSDILTEAEQQMPQTDSQFEFVMQQKNVDKRTNANEVDLKRRTLVGDDDEELLQKIDSIHPSSEEISGDTTSTDIHYSTDTDIDGRVRTSVTKTILSTRRFTSEDYPQISPPQIQTRDMQRRFSEATADFPGRQSQPLLTGGEMKWSTSTEPELPETTTIITTTTTTCEIPMTTRHFEVDSGQPSSTFYPSGTDFQTFTMGSETEDTQTGETIEDETVRKFFSLGKTGFETITTKTTTTLSSQFGQVQQHMYEAGDDETYSSGDFSDSQLSTIPQNITETDSEELSQGASTGGDVVNQPKPESVSQARALFFESQSRPKSHMLDFHLEPTTVEDVENGNAGTGPIVTTTTMTTKTLLDNESTRKSEIKTTTTATRQQQSSSSSSTSRIEEEVIGEAEAEEILKKWGKPLGLPTVHPEPQPESSAGSEGTTGTGTATPKKDKSSRSGPATPGKTGLTHVRKTPVSHHRTKNLMPIHIDLAYVPHHGNSNYCDSEFFRLIRARYYVFSGLEPSRKVFDGLLEGKQAWDDKNLDVTIIPTYDTDSLGYWVTDSEAALTEAHIDLAPSASRCTINLQDHETCCSAYRLEF